VSAADKFNTVTCSLLPGAEFYPVEIVKTAKAAQRRLLEQEFDLILVNTPLPDEFGTELAMDACLRSRAGVLLLVKRELHDEICAKVTDAGVLTLPKPTSEAVMRHMLRTLCAVRERLKRVQERQVTVDQKIEEIRIVDKAKWALISARQMTEEEAHQYIQRQSMDRRISKRTAAEEILRTLQN
jgi:response regulator NasT